MRTPALVALTACSACHVLFPRVYCPPDSHAANVSCAEGQAIVADGGAAYVGYYHCSTEIGLADGGSLAAPDRCNLFALCDGGCPDVAMRIE